MISCVVIAETLLRLIGYYKCPIESNFPAIYLSDDALGFSHNPGSKFLHCSYYGDYEVLYEIDEYGNRKIKSGSNVGNRDILLIGDSYTFGTGVEGSETYAAVLQNYLKNYNVINAGVSGYTIDQELTVLKKISKERGKSLETVVLQITPDNDVEDLIRHHVSVTNSLIDSVYKVDDTYRLNHHQTIIPFYKIFLRKLYLYRFVAEDFPYVLKKVSKKFNAIEERQVKPDDLWSSVATSNSDSVRKYKALSKELIEFCHNEKIRLVIFLLPTESSLRENFFTEVFRSQDVDIVNGSSFLKRDDFLPGDPHINAAGNAKVGMKLGSILSNKLHNEERLNK